MWSFRKDNPALQRAGLISIGWTQLSWRDHNVIQLHHLSRLASEELKSDIFRRRGCSERWDRDTEKVVDGLLPFIAGVECENRLLIDLHANKTFLLRAFIEVSTERECVCSANSETRNVLVDACGVHVCICAGGPNLIKLISGCRRVAGRRQLMLGVDYIGSDPGRKATLEATVFDEIICGGRRASRGIGRLARTSRAVSSCGSAAATSGPGGKAGGRGINRGGVRCAEG